ncbi:MAG: hypothetical protein MPK13_05960 [Gammaproteobacteria bacterium]|nr:hypothetical protein [Gammaproteobacteria bacterium]
MPNLKEFVHLHDLVERIENYKEKKISERDLDTCVQVLNFLEEDKAAGRSYQELRGADIDQARKAAREKERKILKIAALAAPAVVLAAAALIFVDFGQRATPETPPETAAPETDPAAQKLREEFMRAMEQYESEVEPKVAALRLQQWAGEMHAELTGFKTRALEQFTASEYAPALESLRLARAAAAAAEAAYTRQLAELKAAATAAFENDRAEEAQQAVRRALEFKADDAEMRALQPRAAALPQVLELLRQADAARAENRPEKEIPTLEKILELDPARAEQAARLKTLQAESAQDRYAGALRAARRALDAGDLRAAKSQIDLAKGISPNGAEIPPLEKTLRAALAQREFENALASGEAAKRRDDWAAAAKHFARALQLQPNNQTALKNRQEADAVTAASRQIREHLEQPRRLEDLAAADAVAAYAREIAPLTEASAKLRAQHAELTRVVGLYQTEVPVTVVSDNKTQIIVRGIGRVGKTERREIRLRPGARVFEGSREGYKSKLVTLEIAPGASSAEVTVICDEKI